MADSVSASSGPTITSTPTPSSFPHVRHGPVQSSPGQYSSRTGQYSPRTGQYSPRTGQYSPRHASPHVRHGPVQSSPLLAASADSGLGSFSGSTPRSRNRRHHLAAKAPSSRPASLYVPGPAGGDMGQAMARFLTRCSGRGHPYSRQCRPRLRAHTAKIRASMTSARRQLFSTASLDGDSDSDLVLPASSDDTSSSTGASGDDDVDDSDPDEPPDGPGAVTVFFLRFRSLPLRDLLRIVGLLFLFGGIYVANQEPISSSGDAPIIWPSVSAGFHSGPRNRFSPLKDRPLLDRLIPRYDVGSRGRKFRDNPFPKVGRTQAPPRSSSSVVPSVYNSSVQDAATSTLRGIVDTATVTLDSSTDRGGVIDVAVPPTDTKTIVFAVFGVLVLLGLGAFLLHELRRYRAVRLEVANQNAHLQQLAALPDLASGNVAPKHSTTPSPHSAPDDLAPKHVAQPSSLSRARPRRCQSGFHGQFDNVTLAQVAALDGHRRLCGACYRSACRALLDGYHINHVANNNALGNERILRVYDRILHSPDPAGSSRYPETDSVLGMLAFQDIANALQPLKLTEDHVRQVDAATNSYLDRVEFLFRARDQVTPVPTPNTPSVYSSLPDCCTGACGHVDSDTVVGVESLDTPSISTVLHFPLVDDPVPAGGIPSVCVGQRSSVALTMPDLDHIGLVAQTSPAMVHAGSLGTLSKRPIPSRAGVAAKLCKWPTQTVDSSTAPVSAGVLAPSTSVIVATPSPPSAVFAKLDPSMAPEPLADSSSSLSCGDSINLSFLDATVLSPRLGAVTRPDSFNFAQLFSDLSARTGLSSYGNNQ